MSKCPAVDWLIVVYCSSRNFTTIVFVIRATWTVEKYCYKVCLSQWLWVCISHALNSAVSGAVKMATNSTKAIHWWRQLWVAEMSELLSVSVFWLVLPQIEWEANTKWRRPCYQGNRQIIHQYTPRLLKGSLILYKILLAAPLVLVGCDNKK